MTLSKNNINSLPDPKEEIIQMNSYSAPLEDRRNLLRLDFNENTLGPSPKVYEAIHSIKLNEIAIYPEYSLLKKILCTKYENCEKLDSEEIGIFNGADAAINAIFNTFGEKSKLFLTTNPTFGYYFPCAEIQGMKIITSPYEGNKFLFPLKDFKNKIEKFKPKLIFICNPNNPTGTVLKAEEIIELAQINKKSLIVVDELYEKFYGDSLLNKIDFNFSRNIIVVQSLSKTAGLAGLRIGFAFGNNEIIKYIKKVTGPYDVNSFAVSAAIAALNDYEYINNYVLKVKNARSWIRDKFKNINIRSHFSGGNYFLIWPNKEPNKLEKEMREKGILIRNMKNKKFIERSIRVSIGTKEQMELFWRIYKELDLY
tara:strand:+ start:2220 stop:3326 length:1107 start_codon:yes stop_codon:yes gene_type:complete